MHKLYISSLMMALVTTLADSVFAQGQPPDWMWHSSWGWGHMIFGMLMMILFWGGIIVLVVVVIRWVSGHTGAQHSTPSAHKTPLDILKERFARGEIDKEEYEERSKLLSD